MMFRRSADVIDRREGDQTLLFHQKTGWICILNPGATFIWENFTEALSAEEVADRIRQQFTVPDQEADGDSFLASIEHYLTLMQKAQLLETADA